MHNCIHLWLACERCDLVQVKELTCQTQCCYEHAFTISCRKNDVATAQWLASYYPRIMSNHRASNIKSAFLRACRHGNIDILKFLHETFDIVSRLPQAYYRRALTQSCKNAHIDIATWLLVKFPKIKHDGQPFASACLTGNYTLISMLVSDIYSPKIYNKALANACSAGHIYIAEYLADKHTNINPDLALIKACGNGHIDTVTWILQKYKMFTDMHKSLHEACRQSHLDIVQLLVQHVDVDDRAFTLACNEHLDVANFLYQNYKPSNISNGFVRACKHGWITTAQWLSTLGDLDDSTVTRAFSQACRKDSIKILEWLYTKYPCICIEQKTAPASKESHICDVEV